MSVKESVFKAYDVRGIYPSEINEELAEKIAKAFAFLLHADKIVVGRDARKSSPSLHKALVAGFLGMGVDVYDIGECSTPLLNYTAASKGFKGAVMITASHNPAEYNAFKLIKDGIQISSPGMIDDIKRMVMSDTEISPLREQKGECFKLDVLNDYVTEVSSEFKDLKKLKIVVDYGNGMGSITAKPVFEKLGLKIIPLYEEIDCSFPNHQANPVEEKNLEELKKRMLSEKADLGIAFDGDADRSFVIDDKGFTLYPDIMTALLAPFELKGRAEKRIYYDLRSSRIVPEVIRAQKGEPVMMRVGNPFYKEKLKKEGGVFAVEFAGHVMFQDHYCIDDGLYAALKVVEMVSLSKKKLSSLAKPLQKYYSTPEINIKVNDADKTLEIVEKAFPDGEHIDLDGVYVSFPDWWFSLRKSNTEPLVRLRIESDKKEKTEEMKNRILGLIEKI